MLAIGRRRRPAPAAALRQPPPQAHVARRRCAKPRSAAQFLAGLPVRPGHRPRPRPGAAGSLPPSARTVVRIRPAKGSWPVRLCLASSASSLSRNLTSVGLSSRGARLLLSRHSAQPITNRQLERRLLWAYSLAGIMMSDPSACPSNYGALALVPARDLENRPSAGCTRCCTQARPTTHGLGACTRPLRETRNEIRNTLPCIGEERVPARHSVKASGWKCAADRGQPRPTSNRLSKRVPAPACRQWRGPSRRVPWAKRLLPNELRCAVMLRIALPTQRALDAQRRRASLRWRTEASLGILRQGLPSACSVPSRRAARPSGSRRRG